jgi:GNAT superfamily N-acetyltransferase
MRERERVAAEAWAGLAGVRAYLARVDGAPAAAAALRLCDGLALLANASSLPAFRRRGCQTALIGRRLADARAAGCELVCALAAFASPSQRNLERAGLRLAYTKAVWRRYG